MVIRLSVLLLTFYAAAIAVPIASGPQVFAAMSADVALGSGPAFEAPDNSLDKLADNSLDKPREYLAIPAASVCDPPSPAPEPNPVAALPLACLWFARWKRKDFNPC